MLVRIFNGICIIIEFMNDIIFLIIYATEHQPSLSVLICLFRLVFKVAAASGTYTSRHVVGTVPWQRCIEGHGGRTLPDAAESPYKGSVNTTLGSCVNSVLRSGCYSFSICIRINSQLIIMSYMNTSAYAHLIAFVTRGLSPCLILPCTL